MKIFNKVINLLLIIIVLLTLTASVGTAIFHKPVLLTVIQSNSMYPLWQRGDMLVIHNIPLKEQLQKGDMIVFHSEEGDLASKGWIAHRIVEGNSTNGYITKGDANTESDQASGEAPAIKREWIAAKVVTLGEKPFVIPKLGYLSLWVQMLQHVRFILPLITLLLAGIIAYSEFFGKKKRKKKSGNLDLQLVYIGAGFTMSVVAAATMLMNTQFMTLDYTVGTEEGQLSGSAVGMLPVGETRSDTLSSLENSSFMPFIGTVIEDDNQLTINHKQFILHPGDALDLTYTVSAKEKGNYHSSIDVALFYPFLPSFILYKLSSTNYWLALTCASIVPGIPFLAFPFVVRHLRRPMMKSMRKKWRHLKRKVF